MLYSLGMHHFPLTILIDRSWLRCANALETRIAWTP